MWNLKKSVLGKIWWQQTKPRTPPLSSRSAPEDGEQVPGLSGGEDGSREVGAMSAVASLSMRQLGPEKEEHPSNLSSLFVFKWLLTTLSFR